MADGPDLSIYGQFLQAPRSVADYQAQDRKAQLDQLGLLQAQDQRRMQAQQMQRADQLRTLMQGMPGATDEARVQALRDNAFFDQADALEKGIGERAKNAAGVAKTQGETATAAYDLGRKQYEHRIGGLSQFTKPEDARQWLADSVVGGKMSMQDAQRMMQSVPQDPAEFADWRNRTIMSLGNAAEQAKYITPDANAKLQAQTSVATNAATNETSRANNAATVGATIRGQNLTDARAQQQLTQGKWQYDSDRGGVVNVQTAEFKPGVGPDGQPLGPKPSSMKLTEDQGKATGWLVQATNAYDNMQAALKSTPSASKPGLPDVIAGIPSFGVGAAVGNAMRGEDRQKFMQGASSLSEALLRAATGAGVNKEEAEQKIKELVPQFGEKAALTKQKMESIPLYLESLKVRAGPGAAQVPGVFNRARGNTGGASGGWGPAAPTQPGGWSVTVEP